MYCKTPSHNVSIILIVTQRSEETTCNCENCLSGFGSKVLGKNPTVISHFICIPKEVLSLKKVDFTNYIFNDKVFLQLSNTILF